MEEKWYILQEVLMIEDGYKLMKRENVKVEMIYRRYQRRKKIMVEILGKILLMMKL